MMQDKSDKQPLSKLRRQKTGGRLKGTPNKVSMSMKDAVAKFADDNFSAFVESWKKIDNPKDKAQVYIGLLKFLMPTIQSVQLKDDTEHCKRIEDVLDKLQEK